MIKVFKKEYNTNNCYEIRVINIETGAFSHYYQDKTLGFTFSHYDTNVVDMGYKSVTDCLKELKARDFIKNNQEVDYNNQIESEKQGLINLGVYRIKRNIHIDDVILKLTKYGYSEVDANNVIIKTYKCAM